MTRIYADYFVSQVKVKVCRRKLMKAQSLFPIALIFKNSADLKHK